MRKASSINDTSSVPSKAQPISRLENASRITARYRIRPGLPAPAYSTGATRCHGPASFLFPGTDRRAARSQPLQFPLLFDMLQASPQKIDLQRLLSHLALQRRHLLFFRPTAARPGKRSAAELAQLSPPAIQRIRTDFSRPPHFRHRHSHLHPPHSGFLELPREPPASQPHDPILLSLRIVSYSGVSKLGSIPPRCFAMHSKIASTSLPPAVISAAAGGNCHLPGNSTSKEDSLWSWSPE